MDRKSPLCPETFKKKRECVLRERLEMFVVLLMFSVSLVEEKKKSHLAETEETQLYLPGEKERERNGGNCGQSRKC